MHPFSRFSRYFLEVARLGSLRRAAEVLHVSASAINRQILQVEADLGCALFERLPAGLRPTAAGELLMADLRRWDKEYTRTRERFDELQGLRRGQVSLALIDALSEGFVADTVAEIGAAYPQLVFDLRVLDNQQVAEQVGAAEVDIALLLDPVEHGHLEVHAMVDVPLGVVVPPDHPLAAEPHVAFGRLADYRQLLPAAPLIVHERTRRLQAAAAGSRLPSVSCNDVRLMRSLILGGMGIGILSRLDVAAEVADGRLVFVPLRGRRVKPLALAVCVAPRRQLSPAARMTLQRLVQAVKGLRGS
jgi:DNA-binding transcriptional LysR family regulator